MKVYQRRSPRHYPKEEAGLSPGIMWPTSRSRSTTRTRRPASPTLLTTKNMSIMMRTKRKLKKMTSITTMRTRMRRSLRRPQNVDGHRDGGRQAVGDGDLQIEIEIATTTTMATRSASPSSSRS